MSPEPDAHHARHLPINVGVEEVEGRARPTARIGWRGGDLVGVGRSRLAPGDDFREQPGDQMAVARALSDLIRQPFVATARDAETATDHSLSVP